MKNKSAALILLLPVFFLFGCAGQIELARNHYAELANQARSDTRTITHPVDDAFVQEIENGIAYDDASINTSIVWIVYMKSGRFAHGLPFILDPAELERFRSIKGLKHFLTDQLSTTPINERAIMPAAILYGTDPWISNRFLELYKSDEPLPAYTLSALQSAHLTDSKYAPLILDAISKDDPLLVSFAAQYLIDNPISEALPALIVQYQRLDSELNLKSPENIKPPSKMVDPYDIWRFTIGRAIAKYDRDALLEFKDELMSMEEQITFGNMSKRIYNSILIKLADSQEEKMKLLLSDRVRPPVREVPPD